MNLEVLNLSNNRLSNLSRIKLPRLLHLDISENRFSKWSVAPLPHCHVVNAAGNQLITISEIEFGSPRITILNLAENFLVETPARLRFLSILNCSNNSIEHLKTNSIFLHKVRITSGRSSKPEVELARPQMSSPHHNRKRVHTPLGSKNFRSKCKTGSKII